jgi:NAD(P)-dependent dehydrogenase (short-subunit alcohol dehydrogenase family)
MKIIVIGASGTIGRAVVKELAPRHEIILVGKNSGDFQVDMANEKSIEELFQKTGRFDALVSAAGQVHFGPFDEMTASLYQVGLQDKLMGQVNLVLIGRKFINDTGSFTLTSGILSHDPIRFGSSASMVNGAIDSFVRAAALELGRGIRINAVSPTVIQESMPQFAPYFRGFEPVPVSRVALAYSKSVEGLQTGQVYAAGH